MVWSLVRSISCFGAVFFDIVHPEVMALSVGVGNVRATDLLHLVK